MNYDIDGPHTNSIYMAPLKTESYMDDTLGISQLKSFDHYLWERKEQSNDITTEREVAGDEPQILTLASLRNDKCKDIGKLLLTSKRLLTDNGIPRYHVYKRSKATPPKISKKVIKAPPSIKEMKRKIDARKDITCKYNKNKMILIDHDTCTRNNNKTNNKNNNSDSDRNNDRANVCNDQPPRKKRKVMKTLINDNTNALEYTKSELDLKHIDELKKMCKQRHLYQRGSSEKLIERLLDPNNDLHRLLAYKRVKPTKKRTKKSNNNNTNSNTS
eukprot:354459_1